MRRRLDHVDAMRPVKQVGVIGTHSILFFAPAAAVTGSGAALLLLHAAREGFFFISACMLTYAYSGLNRAGLRRFYWRRLISVGIPYLCWTAVYFGYLLPTKHYASLGAALKGLVLMAATGYEQLYFLLVIMQFYLVFPVVLALLRRTRGHHGMVVAAAALAQFAIVTGMHWNLAHPVTVILGERDALSYVLYLIGGCVVAFHFDEVDTWVREHARLIVTLTVAAGLLAEGIYFLSAKGVTTVLGSGSDPFQPSVVPFNAGAVVCVYLAGVALARPRRSRLARAMVRSGVDNAYGIYLSQMIFLVALSWAGWESLSTTVPWPVLCLATVAIVFACGMALTGVLARTPLAMPLTGRAQVPWRPLRVSRPRGLPREARQPGHYSYRRYDDRAGPDSGDGQEYAGQRHADGLGSGLGSGDNAHDLAQRA
jgi:peptidoglycan/LPS O-acetylase OafA/YrhL